MSEVVDVVRAALPAGCEVESCRAQGCELTLAGIARERVIMDMDCLDLSWLGDVQRCDRLFVGEGDFVAAIELKSGDIRASQVFEQLQSGARVAEHYVPDSARVQFRPIAAYGGQLHPNDRDKLRRRGRRIRFRQERFEVTLVRCGSPLLSTLRKTAR